MLVIYTGRSRGGRYVDVGGVEVFVPWGEPIDLPDDLANELVARGDYSVPKPSKPGKGSPEED